ncbi:MAG TPA: S9 family peptidase [Actinomycetota bacterium]|nr:S9 family peptidase [Actinomycetota bacterium]
MSGSEVAPFGSWRSPVDAALAARAATGLTEPRIDREIVYWVERRPAEGGRAVIVRADALGEPSDVIPSGYYARTLVHEYGGGAYTVRDGVVFFTNYDDQRLYRVDPPGEPTPITPEPPEPRSVRYADADVSPDGRWLVCVRERHEVADELPTNELVAVPTDGSAEPAVIAGGSDFFASPRFSPDASRLAWLRWDMPNMPWDGTELVTATFAAGEVSGARVVAGGKTESIFQPDWSPDGTLHLVSDRTGWWNLYRLGSEGEARNLAPMAAEFGVPMWQFGYSSYAFLDDGRVVCAYRRGGEHHLAVLDPASSELIDLDVPYACFDPPYVRTQGSKITFIGSGPTVDRQVALLDFTSRSVEVLRGAEGLGVDGSVFSMPEAIEFPTDDGRTAFAYFYPPHNPGFAAPEGELPPLVVHAHGGPTSESTPGLDPYVQYFTSRGLGFVDVNYGGSTGNGREYRERLYGQWGVVDVRDCIAATRYLVERGRADGARLVVTGGSAGGYVALAALAFHPEAFAAGTSYFGVSDLEPFATFTHKFEFRYTDLLVGPWPEAAELWRERSPVRRADAILRPVLLLQGLEDAVVPPSQAELMIEALEANAVPYAYLAFEGEQHGFRKAENIARSYQAELSFYGQILGFEPAEELPPLELHGAPS